jgi:Carboxymuconolactone decarboxylase family
MEKEKVMKQKLNESARKMKVEKPQFENLIPLAVVIACGCESCAGSSVTRALHTGSSKRDIQKVLATIRYMQSVQCFVERVGQEAVRRMEKPLLVATKTLDEF